MKKYEIKINYIHFNDDCMSIGWSAKGIGFGVLTIHNNRISEKIEYEVETECMGENFYKQVLEEANKHLINYSKIVE